jgi:DNA-binding MarR family transcriptional regulator
LVHLGAHLRKLEDSGFVKINKVFVDRKPRTFISASTEGRKVFNEHVAALEEILKNK